jgi:signal transduction histidine kinase
LGPLPLEKTQIEVIESSSKAKDMYLDILEAATKEIMLIVPTVNAFLRQEKIGAMRLARQAARSRNVKVRILMPSPKPSEQATNYLNQDPDEHINVRYLEQVPGTEATIIAIDRKVSLVMEIRDDSKTTFDEAIGLSTYSNSRAGVLSYVSIFENLWKQTELYEKLKRTNEQLASVIEVLKIHDKSQEEFINVAAHELRTPIQPILSLAEVIHSQITEDKGSYNNDNKMKKYLEPLNVIIRNAKRLQQLSEAVLDITKIESKKLRLNKERFDLNDVIINSLDNMILSSEFTNTGVQLSYQPHSVFLEADKGRISQVISNLLSNAFKFTNKDCGTISISLHKIEDRGKNIDAEEGSHGPRYVTVSITDNGTGIDAEIFPRLFDKFVSKSYHGTGLGLFISKGIVEEHGGKIWAQNNNSNNGRNGATLYFTLPVLDKEHVT